MTGILPQQLRQTLKRRMPAAVRVYRRHLRPYMRREFRGLTMTERFERIYDSNRWGDHESRSGRGSNLAATSHVRLRLPTVLKELNVSSMIDAPCGDFYWMRTLDLAVDYTGVDIVPQIIDRNQLLYGSERRRFLRADITTDELPPAHLILSRDGLVHLSFKDAIAALNRFAATGATYLLTTTFYQLSENHDIATGHWRPLNLERYPFSFRPPLQLIHEQPATLEEQPGKSLGLWRIRDLRL